MRKTIEVVDQQTKIDLGKVMIWWVTFERFGVDWFGRIWSSHSQSDHVRVSDVGHLDRPEVLVLGVQHLRHFERCEELIGLFTRTLLT
jgi:hypothetical protein